MAAKSTGRRADRNRQARRPNAWLLGLFIGIVGGTAVAVTYPAPSVDVMKIQANDWYTNMRDLVAPENQAAGGVTPSDPQIYAAPPVSLPPEADVDDATIDDMDALVDVTAPQPNADELGDALNDEIADLEYTHRVRVTDVATGKLLYNAGGEDAIVPASTLKLFTGVSALEHLGTDHRFVTSAGYDPATGVVLIGGGDGMLSTGESTGRTMGRAGLGDLAQETWDVIAEELPEGQTTIDVWADVSRYAQPTVHPSWTEGLMTSGWVSPVYPMNTYGGFVSNPFYDRTAVEDGAVSTGGAYAQRLTELAQADGRQVEFRYAGQRSQPTQVEPIAQVHSARLGQQLEYAMKQSNNMLFEIFGREAALAAGNSPDFQGSTQTTMDAVQQLGISTEHLNFLDNSGLSPNSRATLESMTQLYDVVMSEEHLRPVVHSLTIAGYDGTMRNRLAEAPYSGLVRSKTGTLEVASSNAGMTVTVDGRALWFAINTAGAEEDYAGARAEQDRLTQVITDCGCSGE
ncbi:D-alanyl-D-alanine carboxypeptidase/D-alanyl-D-alanine-endopeptidase [Yaniella halotolerans]|uniref:D-alanyl-D-alanine carboxypeptidase/D-alanyl-D-alanine-endopeptidase n=1 Tax=Yaniella halotolerans TaxID=225453 RepID=UPI0003B2EE23|nr:D-alanyl-D-alanine carboxypeptidase [Yaniella halotolerans]